MPIMELLLSNLVRVYTSKSYEITYQTHTRLVYKTSTSE